MIIVCERCGKKGTVDEHSYSGKKVRLRCPYCSQDFVFAVPTNGNHSGEMVTEPSAEISAVGAVALPGAAVDGVPDAVVLEAKRIARLIVSEIKLYNQEKIARAASAKEVLDLLRNDLLRGKQHYDSRIAARLPLGPDYFMETVREILLAGKT